MQNSIASSPAAAIAAGKTIADASVVDGLYLLTQNRVVEKAKPVVADGVVEIARWKEGTEPDFRAASHWLVRRRLREWALGKGAAQASNEAIATGEACAGQAVGRCQGRQGRNAGRRVVARDRQV